VGKTHLFGGQVLVGIDDLHGVEFGMEAVANVGKGHGKNPPAVVSEFQIGGGTFAQRWRRTCPRWAEREERRSLEGKC
jgi:hypothetical protein